MEAFAGVGAQRMALQRLRVPFQIRAISEIDKDALIAYATIHCDLLEKLSAYTFPDQDTMLDILQKKRIGFDYVKQKHTLNHRTKLAYLQKVYLADLLTHNLGDISLIRGRDIQKLDLLTYSFPCTDLSKAGRMEGMRKGSQTRSGLLWQVERLLLELYELHALPQILLMENVPDVIGSRNKRDFDEWYRRLEQLGYQSFYKVLDAKDYGIPQHRERCYMVSILGAYVYTFPEGIPLTRKLRELLEHEVDEAYYLNERRIHMFSDMSDRNGFIRGDRFQPYAGMQKGVAKTLLTRAGQCPTDNYLYQYEPVQQLHTDEDDSVQWEAVQDAILLPENTRRGFVLAQEGDGVYINRTASKRGVVQKQMIQTIKCSVQDLGVVQNMRIRRLTPRECWRIMDFTDADHDRCVQAGISETAMFKLAGNSIVVAVLTAIFRNLFVKKEVDDKDGSRKRTAEGRTEAIDPCGRQSGL